MAKQMSSREFGEMILRWPIGARTNYEYREWLTSEGLITIVEPKTPHEELLEAAKELTAHHARTWPSPCPVSPWEALRGAIARCEEEGK